MQSPSGADAFDPDAARPDWTDDGPSFVVGIGASAGGLEALEELFQALPSDTGSAFVVIQHLSPDFESLMDELLGRRTAMPILRAEDGMALARDTVYLIPPAKGLALQGHLLRVTQRPPGVLNFPIDVFFRSLAKAYDQRAVAIVLSGTGTDGSRGIRDVRDAGGLVLVQDELSAKFSGMPVSAAASGLAHAIIAPQEMPNKLLQHAKAPDSARALDPDQQSDLKEVSILLLENHGLDLSQYKSLTVLRRIERRMSGLGVTGVSEYIDRLRSDAEELASLHHDLLIGVTKFFRDPSAFEKIEAELPAIFQNAGRDGPRIWVSGCATGQEAYTLAALLREHAVKEKLDVDQIKVFATDVNRESLSVASAGVYPRDQIEASPEVLKKHFDEEHGMYTVQADLRRMIVFAPHNLLKDPPFTRIDLVSCRNVLIYLTPAAQHRVISLFHFALRRNGLLFLGPSESLGDLDSEFEPIHQRSKIFQKRRDIRLSEKIHMERTEPASLSRAPLNEDPMVHSAFHALLQRYVPTTLMVNERHQVVHVFGDASKYLMMGPGRTSLNVESVLHPDLRTPVVAAINRIRRTRQAISYPGLPISTEDADHKVKLVAEAIRDRRLKADLYLISVEREERQKPDVPAATTIRIDEASRLQASDLREELRATEERLETTIEELETSNEELQATNEELLSSNEEMQSTNEELQSVNEELYTVNAEHQRKIAELVELNQDLDNLLRGTAIETLFLDRELRIRRYTPSVAQSFSLLPADVGRPLGHLASNLTYDGVLADARQVLASGTPIEHEVANSRGTWLMMSIRPYRTTSDLVEGVVITFSDITRRKQLERQVARQSLAMQTVLDTNKSAVFVIEQDGHRTVSNTAAKALFEEWGDPREAGDPGDGLRARIESVFRTGESQASTSRLTRADKSRDYRYELTPVSDEVGQIVAVACAIVLTESV